MDKEIKPEVIVDADDEVMSPFDMRVAQVQIWIARFWPRHAVQAEGQKLFKVSSRQIDRYMEQAKINLKAVVVPDREELIRESQAYWQDFIYRMQEAGKPAMEIQGRIHYEKLMGLLPGETVDGRNTAQDINITLEEKS